MKTHIVTFWDKEEKPVKLTEAEYQKAAALYVKGKPMVLSGDIRTPGEIKNIKKIKIEPLGLPVPQGKPISKSRLEKLKQQISEKFSWNKI